MSTILKALKKLETEPSPEESPAEAVKSTPSKVTIGTEGFRPKKRTIISISGCILLTMLWVGHRVFFAPAPLPVAKSQSVPGHRSTDKAPKKNDATSAKPQMVHPAEKPVARSPIAPPKTAPNSPPPSTAAENKPLEIEKPISRPAPRPKPADIQLIDDPRLQLQAIAWSEQAKDRIAVINGALIREGGKLKGLPSLRSAWMK